MEKKLDLSRLDFDDIDLTAPNLVVEEILKELSKETKGIVEGKILPYKGHITSYTKQGFAGVAAALSGRADEYVDIQKDLGRSGVETHKYELFLCTPSYEHYKFRICFFSFNTGNYPVSFVLQENVADSISLSENVKCVDRTQVENLLYRILNSKYIIGVMQEIIRINQVKRDTTNDLTDFEE